MQTILSVYLALGKTLVYTARQTPGYASRDALQL